MHGNYLPGCTVRHGSFTWYAANGALTDSIQYEKNAPLYCCSFYPGGQKKILLVFNKPNQLRDLHSWAPTGEELSSQTFYADFRGYYCNADTARWKITVEKKENLFYFQNYFAGSDTLVSDGMYESLSAGTPVFTRYFRLGKLRDSVAYSRDKSRTCASFLNSGKLCSLRVYDSLGAMSSARSWKESGEEIAPDTTVTYAVPLEGFRNWQRKVLKQINGASLPGNIVRKDLYGSVFIGFYVDEDGVGNSAWITESSPYPQMDSLVLAVCKAPQRWHPCRVNGRSEQFFGVHSFTFVKGKVIRYKTLY